MKFRGVVVCLQSLSLHSRPFYTTGPHEGFCRAKSLIYLSFPKKAGGYRYFLKDTLQPLQLQHVLHRFFWYKTQATDWFPLDLIKSASRFAHHSHALRFRGLVLPKQRCHVVRCCKKGYDCSLHSEASGVIYRPV
jgi:hypothetical protein